jgi:hypothetical protein
MGEREDIEAKNARREFIDADKDVEVSYLEALKKHKIGSNLDLL